jgi:signal transduction histidine kinase
LVVDDVATIRLMLLHSVRQLGHVPTAAANGVEALAQLRENPFDLVLLDVMMPEMDGFTVLDQMKKDPDLREIPVLMVTGLDELASAVRCIEAGADDYLTKPLEPALLSARIRTCLEKKHLADELRERYRQLKRMEEMRDSLTSMVVHDLRTPLTSLLAGLQSIPLMGPMSEIQSELLEMATTGGETLLSLINDLLDVSKMEAEGLVFEVEDVEVHGLVDEALAQTSALARQKQLDITKAAEAGLLPVQASSEKTRRVLVNLIGNAIKATPAGGRITVEVAKMSDESTIRFTVRDTGQGIPREAFQRIFEKFGQVDAKKEERAMSTGLGLTFCKMAVEAQGGRIWVESEVGVGSAFSFVLPIGREPSA